MASSRMAALSYVKALGLARTSDACDRPEPRARDVADLLSPEHVKFVARSLRRLGVNESDIDDGVQEVFVIASSKREMIAEGAERSFLYGTAMRVASNARRVERRAQSRRAEAPEGREHVSVDATPNAEELLARRQARERLDAILATMSVEMRAVFTLFELEEMTRSEIAALLGLPLGTVGSRIRRAREHFEEQVRIHKMKREQEGGAR